MHTVQLWGGLRPYVGGAESVQIDAGNISDLLHKLAEQYPKLESQIDNGISVSVNGTIYQDDWSQSIPLNAEIYLLPRIEGG